VVENGGREINIGWLELDREFAIEDAFQFRDHLQKSDLLPERKIHRL